MRFDDRLATILCQPTGSESARTIAWGQVVDLLAQGGHTLNSEIRSSAFAWASSQRSDVPVERRRFAALSVAGRSNDPEMVRFFAQDAASVAAPLLTQTTLSEAAWLEIIPGLPTTSRALLRERRDLPAAALHLLRAYGPGDNALPTHALEAVPIVEDPAPIAIRDLVARIEAFKSERAGEPRIAPQSFGSKFDRSEYFRFETDRDGLLNWIEGAPRGALVGIALSEMAEPGSFGVDGHVAGAFRKRAAFRDARLLVAGTGPVGGDWLISADPLFDFDNGRFLGFRGIGRRPNASSTVRDSFAAPFGDGMTSDSIRQLVHEIRSPLNAIQGFAQMIEAQLLGPVSHPYRENAHNIVHQANHLVALVEDLDMAARLDLASGKVRDGSFDVASSLLRLASRGAPHGVRFDLTTMSPASQLTAAIDPVTGERMLARLFTLMTDLAPNETLIQINAKNDAGWITIETNVPIPPAAGTDIPVVGIGSDTHPSLGFTFRLLRHMSRSVGGQFRIDDDKLILILPPTRDGVGINKESG